MTAPEILRLQLDEARPVAVQIHKEASARSPHTGRDLRELHGWIVSSDSQLNQYLANVLPRIYDRPLRADDEAGEFAGRWCVSWNSYGESAGVHTYTLILREAEELSLRVLLLDGVELHPYEYREEVVAGRLRIRAKLVGGEADVVELRRLAGQRDSFAVVREGIQDEPRQMELNVEEWSPFEDRVKYRISLADIDLDDAPDDDEEEGGADGNREALAFYANYLEQLAEMLVRKNLLSREELRGLRHSARLDRGVTLHELWRVTDVDQA